MEQHLNVQQHIRCLQIIVSETLFCLASLALQESYSHIIRSVCKHSCFGSSERQLVLPAECTVHLLRHCVTFPQQLCLSHYLCLMCELVNHINSKFTALFVQVVTMFFFLPFSPVNHPTTPQSKKKKKRGKKRQKCKQSK